MDAAQTCREVVVGDSEAARDAGGGFQVFVQLGFLQLAGQAVDVRHERALAVARDDHALGLEVQVGAFDGDDGDGETGRKCRIDGSSLPGIQSPAAMRCRICSMIWRYIGRASVWEMFMPLYILCIHSIYSAPSEREGEKALSTK